MRMLRILAASVWYFVSTAVNNREPLFWSRLERARFMRGLNEARAGFRRALGELLHQACRRARVAGDYAVGQAAARCGTTCMTGGRGTSGETGTSR
ncbi:MAG: hypothetical protein LBK61_01070 [Spirochaetaceae bacterium]|nr:hypothetical protein [Spirochaetaceae bacterium]